MSLIQTSAQEAYIKRKKALALIGVTDELNILVGMTLSRIEKNKHETELKFTTTEGITLKMFHQQDCCESVYIEDICGDLDDLIGSPLTMAEEVSNYEPPNAEEPSYGSQTWTFYKFATVKGYVTIRWLGESNGYYSESVDLEFNVQGDSDD